MGWGRFKKRIKKHIKKTVRVAGNVLTLNTVHDYKKRKRQQAERIAAKENAAELKAQQDAEAAALEKNKKLLAGKEASAKESQSVRHRLSQLQAAGLDGDGLLKAKKKLLGL